MDKMNQGKILWKSLKRAGAIIADVLQPGEFVPRVFTRF